jgi:twitching motility protein PilI
MNREITDAREHWLSPSAALSRLQSQADVAIGLRQTATVTHTRFGFRVGQLRLLIKPRTHSEVVAQPHIYPIPNVPQWFLGVITLRGNLLPVFSLQQLLQPGSGSQNTHTVLLLDQSRDAVGVPIEGLPQSVALQQELRDLPSLPEALQEHVTAAYVTNGMIWLDFDHQSFFTALGRHIAS